MSELGPTYSSNSTLTGAEIQFAQVLRKMEELWRAGFVGKLTVHCGEGGATRLEYTEFWKPGQERRSSPSARRGPPRKG